MRSPWKALAVLALLALGFAAAPAQAGVPTVVLGEDFGYIT